MKKPAAHMPGEAEHFVKVVDISAALVLVDMSEGLELSELEYNAQLQYSQALRSLDRNACFQEQNFRNWHKHAWWIVTF